eukprot:TRINITY_DN29582_c0_g1_i2.p1 TRINITY_DN29582_c0_g1~~TRINITY_DN29582_c0_g1_i2.p1  ORF type:complete len:102 (-),score=19.96 TRINITY_DN29582_c0_g1_i2:123-428(-)
MVMGVRLEIKDELATLRADAEKFPCKLYEVIELFGTTRSSDLAPFLAKLEALEAEVASLKSSTAQGGKTDDTFLRSATSTLESDGSDGFSYHCQLGSWLRC